MLLVENDWMDVLATLKPCRATKLASKVVAVMELKASHSFVRILNPVFVIGPKTFHPFQRKCCNLLCHFIQV